MGTRVLQYYEGVRCEDGHRMRCTKADMIVNVYTMRQSVILKLWKTNSNTSERKTF
jgi:hypothetical protein